MAFLALVLSADSKLSNNSLRAFLASFSIIFAKNPIPSPSTLANVLR